MQAKTQRKCALFTVVSGMAICGALGGYLAGRVITLKFFESQLVQYATRLMTDGEATSGALRTELKAVSFLEHPACSNAEIKDFRSMVFESEYTKDIGRMRDGKILCSANMGRVSRRKTFVQPDITQPDGTLLYGKMPEYENGNVETIGLQQGDTFLVFTPLTHLHIEPLPMHFTESQIDAPTQKVGRIFGESFKASQSILMTEGQGRLGENLYATRCSIRFYNCITAFSSLPEALATGRRFYLLSLLMGTGMGAAFGLLCALLYRRNQSMEQQLRRAIAKDELQVFYQPVVHLANRRIVGAEALLRWSDQDGNAVAPDVFVRLAEDRGFVGELTRLVVRIVLRDFGKILRGSPAFRININVTATDLSDPDFLPFLESSLVRTGVSPHNLGIEITESGTARHQVVFEAVSRLQTCGHKVYIDDFGTGYSSLAYLHDLSVDAIKIDRAFTQAIGTESVTVGILPQILAMAKSLNLQVVVEGVETEEQAEYFSGGDSPILAQGWLFGRPVKLTDLLCRLPEEEKRTVGAKAIKLEAAS